MRVGLSIVLFLDSLHVLPVLDLLAADCRELPVPQVHRLVRLELQQKALGNGVDNESEDFFGPSDLGVASLDGHDVQDGLEVRVPTHYFFPHLAIMTWV